MVGSGRGSAVSVALGGRAEIKGAWRKCCCALDLIFRHLDRHIRGHKSKRSDMRVIMLAGHEGV